MEVIGVTMKIQNNFYNLHLSNNRREKVSFSGRVFFPEKLPEIDKMEKYVNAFSKRIFKQMRKILIEAPDLKRKEENINKLCGEVREITFVLVKQGKDTLEEAEVHKLCVYIDSVRKYFQGFVSIVEIILLWIETKTNRKDFYSEKFIQFLKPKNFNNKGLVNQEDFTKIMFNWMRHSNPSKRILPNGDVLNDGVYSNKRLINEMKEIGNILSKSADSNRT